ncbi:MAG: hypothetical protein Q8936_23360 [Bacillota bacterium]|nr:hypothetical protein [Bacillota bacterium]
MNTLIVIEAIKLEKRIIKETKDAGYKYLAMKVKDNGHVAYKQTNSEVAKKILSQEGYIVYDMQELK